jgi:hypothetical protein
MNRGCVPVLRTAEPCVPFDQRTQRLHIALIRRGERVPDDAPLNRIEFRRLDDRAAGDTDDRLDVPSQGIPGCEPVAFGDRVLRIPQTAGLGLTTQQFLGLTLELIE